MDWLGHCISVFAPAMIPVTAAVPLGTVEGLDGNLSVADAPRGL